MRRKLIAFLQASSVLVLFFLLVASFSHLQSQSGFGALRTTSSFRGWIHSLGGSSPGGLLKQTKNRPATPPPVPNSSISKKANDTLLNDAPKYIQAIFAPKDTTFPRLECSAPNGDRYQHLRRESNGTSDSATILKYFFALDLYQCASLLPRLLGSIVESMRFLGPRSCALSVVEGRSDDGTFEILSLLREEIERMGAKYFLQTNEINPRAKGGNRIKALAELRNQAIEPLIQMHSERNTELGARSQPDDGADTTVIFLNDVAICMEDILELIYQRDHQKADMTCAMDWTYVGPDPTFYDVWIARGMNGDSFFEIPPDGNWNSAWNLFWNNPDAKQKNNAGKPFQVFSCWNGAVTFTAKPFLDRKIQFRSAMENECAQGEPKSFCKDLWMLGYGKIAVVPSVNLEYSDEGGKKIKAAKGYVSSFVGEEGDKDDVIEWKWKPPDRVKCIPNYEHQHWRPWDEKRQNQTEP